MARIMNMRDQFGSEVLELLLPSDQRPMRPIERYQLKYGCERGGLFVSRVTVITLHSVQLVTQDRCRDIKLIYLQHWLVQQHRELGAAYSLFFTWVERNTSDCFQTLLSIQMNEIHNEPKHVFHLCCLALCVHFTTRKTPLFGRLSGTKWASAE